MTGPEVGPIDGIVVGDDGVARCWWCVGDAEYERYHDEEWGRPVGEDRRLFEKIALESFMSGLSWLTILRKRDAFRRAFHGFDPHEVAGFDGAEVEELMADASIVRNRAKIEATVNNARRYPELVAEFGSLAAFIWRHEPPPEARRVRLDFATLTSMPPSFEARAMSDGLRRRGWSFVGPTTAYSVMEAMGVVNDHLEGCSAREDVERARAAFVRPR